MQLSDAFDLVFFSFKEHPEKLIQSYQSKFDLKARLNKVEPYFLVRL